MTTVVTELVEAFPTAPRQVAPLKSALIGSQALLGKLLLGQLSSCSAFEVEGQHLHSITECLRVYFISAVEGCLYPV